MITLSGEADLTSAAQLSALIAVQLSGGTRHLTIDASGLSFADSATVRALVLAARTLKSEAEPWSCCTRKPSWPGCWP